MAALAAVMVSLALAPAAPAAGPIVQMVDNEPDLTNWHFDPAQLTVPAGSTTSTAMAPKAPKREAAPAGSHRRSGGHLAGTIVLVLGPTLAGLALGAKLRQSH